MGMGAGLVDHHVDLRGLRRAGCSCGGSGYDGDGIGAGLGGSDGWAVVAATGEQGADG